LVGKFKGQIARLHNIKIRFVRKRVTSEWN